MKKYLVTADCEWIVGHLRWGHYEAELTEEQYQKYLKAKENGEENDYVRDVCDLIVDDWRIEDCENPTNIQIKEIEE